MPEVGDHYIGAEILLPRGDEMTRSHVVAWNHDARGSIMRKSHTNPILNTRMYQVEFAGGKVTELTASVPLQSQCTCNVMQMGISIYSWIH